MKAGRKLKFRGKRGKKRGGWDKLKTADEKSGRY